jgi:hypothetical protein
MPGTSRAVSARLAAVRPTTSTCAPCSAKARAVARPMPVPPPVTITALPANCVVVMTPDRKD